MSAGKTSLKFPSTAGAVLLVICAMWVWDKERQRNTGIPLGLRAQDGSLES